MQSSKRSPLHALTRSFTEHPASAGESYARHMGTASGYALRLIGGGLAAAMHGLLPFLFQTTASDMIFKMHDEMQEMQARRAGVAPTGRSGAPVPDAGPAPSLHREQS